MLIHFSYFMLQWGPHCAACLQRRPALWSEDSHGPSWVRRSPKGRLRAAILTFKDIYLGLTNSLFIRFPCENFTSFLTLFLTSPRDPCQQPGQQSFCSAVPRVFRRNCQIRPKFSPGLKLHTECPWSFSSDPESTCYMQQVRNFMLFTGV